MVESQTSEAGLLICLVVYFLMKHKEVIWIYVNYIHTSLYD